MAEALQINFVPAPGPLKRWVAGAWSVDAPAGHSVRATPDGCIDIVLVANERFDGVFVCGPLRAFSKHALSGTTRLRGVTLRPGVGAILGVRADGLPQNWIALRDLGVGGTAPGPRDGFAGLFAWIEARAATAEVDRRVEDAVQRMRRTGGQPRIRAIAREMGVSVRTLTRLFERHVGMPPTAYRRILRFNRALSKLRSTPGEALAELALSTGFADQSHMARELRELGGLTPGEVSEVSAPNQSPLASCPG